MGLMQMVPCTRLSQHESARPGDSPGLSRQFKKMINNHNFSQLTPLVDRQATAHQATSSSVDQGAA